MYTKQRKATLFTVSNCMCLCVYLTTFDFQFELKPGENVVELSNDINISHLFRAIHHWICPKISRISLFQLNVTDIRNLISMETIWIGIHCVCYTLQIILIYKWEMIPIKMFVLHIIFVNRALFLNS